MKFQNHERKTYIYDEFYYIPNETNDDYIHLRRRVWEYPDWEYIEWIGDFQDWITYEPHFEVEKLYQEFLKSFENDNLHT